MNRSLDVTSSWIASVLRMGAGYIALRNGAARPEQSLQLYEFEACPFCRRVREALSELDLPATIYPCAKGSPHRELVVERGGKQQFPCLVDPNTGVTLYGSTNIIAYLREHYSDRGRGLSLGPLSVAGGAIASGLRAGRGGRAVPARQPQQLLKLWSFEASPYCRIVRERLCELSLPYHLVNIAKRSSERPAFLAAHGKIQVPYLEDPNTGVAMFESAEIVAYLDRTYAA